MENETNNQSIKDNVLAAAESGRIKMRPKWYFILTWALGAFGAIILLLTMLFLASVAFFTMRHTGAWFTPVFGMRGWFFFFQSLPWLLILLAAVALIILEVIVHRYSFSYRRPLLFTLFAIVFIAALGGLLLAKTPMHKNILNYSVVRPIPAAQGFYRQFERPMERNVFVGKILEITKDGFVIESPRKESIRINVISKTRLPLGADFSAGDMVVVFGEPTESGIEAYGVKEIENGDEFFIFNLAVPNVRDPHTGPGANLLQRAE